MLTLTSDLTELMRCILQDPMNDTLRLVYADAIQDEGHEEIAELIRVQIDSARSGEKLSSEVCSSLVLAAKAMLGEDYYVVTYFRHYLVACSYKDSKFYHIMFDRGFPALLSSNASYFYSNWMHFFKRFLITHVYLSDISMNITPNRSYNHWEVNFCGYWHDEFFEYDHTDLVRLPSNPITETLLHTVDIENIKFDSYSGALNYMRKLITDLARIQMGLPQMHRSYLNERGLEC